MNMQGNTSKGTTQTSFPKDPELRRSNDPKRKHSQTLIQFQVCSDVDEQVEDLLALTYGNFLHCLQDGLLNIICSLTSAYPGWDV